MEPILRLNRFDRGIVDAYGPGKTPDGSFADSKNLLPTKEGALEVAYGYEADLATIPDGPLSPTSGDDSILNLTGPSAHPFAYSSEDPSSHDGRVYFFTDTNSTKHIALKPWYKDSTTAQTGNSGFVFINEYKEISADATFPTAGDDASKKIVIANASTTHGLSTTANYYKHWRVEYWIAGATNAWGGASEGESMALIKSSTYDSGTGELTIVTYETLNGASGMGWGDFGTPAGGKLTFRRFFHRPENMIPTFGTKPGQCWQSQNRVRGCGGANSSQHYFPWIAQYINRTFFSGATGGESFTYQGTYVDEMECRPEAGINSAAIASGVTVAGGATSTSSFDDDVQYSVATTLEYDGYEESRLSAWAAASTVTLSDNQINFNLSVRPARMSKRVTAVNLYVREEREGVTGAAYFIKRLSLTTSTSANWTWVEADGVFAVTGTTGNIGSITADEWYSRGSTYYQRTQRLEEGTSDRHVVAWKYAQVMNDRLFVANFYDPNEALTFVDEVRFSCQGALGMDVIPYDRTNYEFSVGRGSPEAIKGIIPNQGWLIIFKDGSIHGKYINTYPETWVGMVISTQDGLASEDSLVPLPQDMIGFADTDAFKIMRNQRIFPVTTAWETTYQAFTGKSTCIAWYDKIDQSLRFTNGVDTSGRYVYVVYPFKEGYPMYKLQLDSNTYVQYVLTERDGDVIFGRGGTGDSYPVFYKWVRTDYSYYSTNAIVPYLQTNQMVLDESKDVLVEKFVIVKSGDCASGYLNNKLYIDSTQVLNSSSLNPWGATADTGSGREQDKTKKYLFQFLPVDANRRIGKRVQVIYNTNGAGEYYISGRPRIDSIDIYGVVVGQVDKSI